MNRLPDKLSEAILVALRDLEACIQDPRYTIDFNSWHQIHLNQFNQQLTCSVCLAGSVMAKSLDAEYGVSLEPSVFEEENMLMALDKVRRGYIEDALDQLEIESDIEDTYVPQDDYPAFVIKMKEISELLKSKGL